MRAHWLPVLTVVLSLAACAPERAEADKKLSSACEAAIRALAGPGAQIEIRTTAFEKGTGVENVPLRIVKFTTLLVQDHGEVQGKSYTCSFKEQWHMFGVAQEFYSLEKDQEKYGNFDGHIEGDILELQKINDAVSKNLY